MGNPSRVEVFSLNETRESLIPKVRRMGRYSISSCLAKWRSLVTVTRKALASNGSITVVYS